MEVTDELIKNTMDLLAAMAAEQIAADTGVSDTRALGGLLSSRTGQMLYDEETKLWWDGPAAIADLYEKEMEEERMKGLKGADFACHYRNHHVE